MPQEAEAARLKEARISNTPWRKWGPYLIGSNHVAGYSAWQNNFKYVAGVNFTFGK